MTAAAYSLCIVSNIGMKYDNSALYRSGAAALTGVMLVCELALCHITYW